MLSQSFGLSAPGNLDLSFLSVGAADPAGHLFFENTHQVPRETPGAQQTIARLDLNYYIPCHAQQKTIAVLGLGKTTKGDFSPAKTWNCWNLWAAISALPFRTASSMPRCSRRWAEYERLKDFNENIVESINVGVIGARHGRPHRELERADGSDVRGAAMADYDPAAQGHLPAGVLEEFNRHAAEPWHS